MTAVHGTKSEVERDKLLSASFGLATVADWRSAARSRQAAISEVPHLNFEHCSVPTVRFLATPLGWSAPLQPARAMAIAASTVRMRSLLPKAEVEQAHGARI